MSSLFGELRPGSRSEGSLLSSDMVGFAARPRTALRAADAHGTHCRNRQFPRRGSWHGCVRLGQAQGGSANIGSGACSFGLVSTNLCFCSMLMCSTWTTPGSIWPTLGLARSCSALFDQTRPRFGQTRAYEIWCLRNLFGFDNSGRDQPIWAAFHPIRAGLAQIWAALGAIWAGFAPI